MIEFPKMIYRPRTEPNSDFGGMKLDSLIVHSSAEQDIAVGQGWSVELASAMERVASAEKRSARLQAVRSWYERWEWSFKAVAVLLAIIAGAVALWKVL